MQQLSPGIAVNKNMPLVTRDGVTLYADVYRPDSPGRFPALVMRTPYSKEGSIAYPNYFVPSGYIVVVQDVRGRFTSQGEYYPHIHEAQDGYETVEWAATLPWCDGNVGTIGQSYMGATQYMLACSPPPHLRCMVPISASSDLRQSWVYHTGGTLELGWIVSYAIFKGRNTAQRKGIDATPLEDYLAPAANFAQPLTPEAYSLLPLCQWADILRDVAPYFADYLAHPDDGPYWWWTNLRLRHSQVRVPMFHISSWYDIFLEGALSNFCGLASNGIPQKLLVGPWGHLLPYTVPTSGGTGDADFGPEAPVETLPMMRRWLDYWLKGIDNGIADEPPVRFFVMGENRWREDSQWPPPGVRYTRYFLHSGGSANRLAGDGTLDAQPPSDEPPDAYTYDPNDPVPTRGGNTLILPIGVFDQRPVEERPDVLVYTSPVVEQDMEVTGPITVTLYAASSATDTDFTAKLVDVEPDGYARNIQDGIIRARYRDSQQHPSLITPGEIYCYTIDLWATSHVFKAGHRIRLEISSSNFPRFDRNLNSGAPLFQEARLLAARQTIFHDAQRPSHITLPVLPH